MSIASLETLRKYFAEPYHGHVFILNSTVTLADIQQHSFTEILSHKNAPNHLSMATSIFNAMYTCANGFYGKKILDIGGGTGYFSFLAEEAGAETTMIERDIGQATVAKTIADIRGLKVNIINTPIQTFLSSCEEKYDCAFMLNMFDQMLREDETIAYKVLKQVSERTKMLFLMMGPTMQIPTAKGIMTGTPLIPATIIMTHTAPDYEVILEKTGYKKYENIATHIYGTRQLQAYF